MNPAFMPVESTFVSSAGYSSINFEVIRPNVTLFVRNEDLELDVEQQVVSGYLDRKYHEVF